MNELQTITLRDVVVAGRKAYEEGRLTAQNGGECMYRQEINGKECRCVVGAAMTDETLDQLEASSNMSGKVSRDMTRLSGRFTIPDSDLFAIQDLQNEHDFWCFDVAGAEEIFLRALERFERRLGL